MHNTTTTLTLLTILLTTPALAQQLASRTQLETILDDQIILEDFESISVHAGSSILMPNPLTADNSNNAVHQGLTFTAQNTLHLVGGFSNGDDNVYLRADGALTIDFTEPQNAFGFNFFSGFGAPPFDITILARDGSILQQIEFQFTTSTFFGYNASTQGISSVTIAHPSLDLISINDLAYGSTFLPCPADLNNDNAQDFFDISAFLSFFAEKDDRADFTDDGQFDFFDVSAFLTAFTIACP